MRILSYIIADDDEMYCDYTQEQLALIPGIKCLATCNNAIEARSKIAELNPDFVVLDVEMPNLSGIDLVKSLKTIPLVIFVTSHPDFATEAFDIDAVDYLLKPAKTPRMLRAIDKIKKLSNIRYNAVGTDNFTIKEDDSFFIKDKSVYTKIFYNEVLYFESLGDFTYIFLSNNEKKVVLSGMKSIENQLPSTNFLRISRSHIINLNAVTILDSETVFLGKINLLIGKTYNEQVSKIILGNQVIKRYS